MTLYLKYRSKSLEELDLPEVRESLTKIFKSGNVPHAFLFSGPKGTGKTSAARIVAKAVNCLKPHGPGESCGECEQCISIAKGNNLDVIEIDAASHRGIDDIRSLRDAVKLAPAKGNKKIYIIDEAHMLTLEASNALLKTLEEPPDHVIFILATTNPEKLISTIRSRTTIIPFRKAKTDEIVSSLRRVAKGEKIKISDGVMVKISEAAGGSFRDAAKILEQLVLEVDSLEETEKVAEYLNRNSQLDIEDFIVLLTSKRTKDILKLVEESVEKGIAIDEFMQNLLNRLHNALLAKSGVSKEDIETLNSSELVHLIELMQIAYSQLKQAPIEQLPLEMAVVRWCGDGEGSENKKTGDSGGGKKRIEEEEEEISSVEEKKRPIIAQSKINEGSLSVEEKLEKVAEETWTQILSKIKPINTSMEALLRAAKPIGCNAKTLKLGVFYKFHKERLEDKHHRKVLEDVVQSVMGNPLRVICTLTEPPQKKILEEKKEETVLTEGQDQDIIRVAEEIFTKE